VAAGLLSVEKLADIRQVIAILPASFGKGYTQVIAAVLALELFSDHIEKVNIVVCSEQTALRELSDNAELRISSGHDDKIKYLQQVPASSDIPLNNKTLLMIDEVDAEIYADPERLAQAILRSDFFLGWTATLDRNNAKLKKFLELNKVAVVDFDLGCDLDSAKKKIQFDEKLPPMQNEQLVQRVLEEAAHSVCIVYCDSGVNVLFPKDRVEVVTDQTPFQKLRDLQNFSSGCTAIVLINDEKFMRNSDFRCGRSSVSLFVWKAFSSPSLEMQGLARVGRQGDACKRYVCGNPGFAVVDKNEWFRREAKVGNYLKKMEQNPKLVPSTIKEPMKLMSSAQSKLAFQKSFGSQR
jgi:hypothetical protein